MKRLVRLLVPALLFVGMAAQPALAQDKAKAAKAEKGKVIVKVLHEDDRVRVTEVTFRPGDVGPNIERPLRVVRALKGGTLERTYPDGKTEKREWKAGQVRVSGPDKPFTPKNIGKSTIVLYSVQIKQAK